MIDSQDTIAAIATAPGRGGVGIVRLSGPDSLSIAKAMTGNKPVKERFAHYREFYDCKVEPRELIDFGLLIYFPGPNSFTGEDVVELQGHGGPVVMNRLLAGVVALGARLARPGEFSERAFLNDKMDLTQAEAIADLIESSSDLAARNALHSLQGLFKLQIEQLLEKLIQLRVYVEAAIDFPDEEVDFLSDGHIEQSLRGLEQGLRDIMASARQGALIRDGISVVLAGAPNAGKSSLLNALAGRDTAIVTDIAGTTRDVLKEHIQIDGMPLHIIDTAGLRESDNPVEQEGIRRALAAVEKADCILLVIDSQNSAFDLQYWLQQLQLEDSKRLTLIYNKIDQSGAAAGKSGSEPTAISLSAKTGDGIDFLRQHLKDIAGYDHSAESQFTARQRHITALEKASKHFELAKQQLLEFHAGELVAEELRLSQHALGEITGEFTSDDLLGEIFSSFCIGK